MSRAIYLIARLDGCWTVGSQGRSLGVFADRPQALRFAVQNACISAENGVPAVILAEDQAGANFVVWSSERDHYSTA